MNIWGRIQSTKSVEMFISIKNDFRMLTYLYSKYLKYAEALNGIFNTFKHSEFYLGFIKTILSIEWIT
ncbi:hypothetical protein HYD99_00840 [Mycoplasmopsis bovis]|nr:hypothetical protein [Mycoplasmopsis bovis]QQH28873.1 hypothetical protein HYD99_00840 [Mycoplasmopsis bovis]